MSESEQRVLKQKIEERLKSNLMRDSVISLSVVLKGKKDYYSEPDASDLFMMQGIVRGREDDFQNGESKDEGDRGDLEV